MTAENTAPEAAAKIDLEYQPKSYWATGKPDEKVEIASVDWNGNKTYYLLAYPNAEEVDFTWRVDGDSDGVPDDPEPLLGPLTLEDLASTLEEYCLAEADLDGAWDTAWSAAQENVDLDDSEAVGFALDEVAEAYSFSSDIYKQLSDYYDQRFQSWRDQQSV